MMKKNNKRAQTITEYILLVCLLAAGSILVVTKLGNVIRGQLSAAALSIAGESGSQSSNDAKEDAKGTKQNIRRSLDDFWRQNSTRSNER